MSSKPSKQETCALIIAVSISLIWMLSSTPSQRRQREEELTMTDVIIKDESQDSKFNSFNMNECFPISEAKTYHPTSAASTSTPCIDGCKVEDYPPCNFD